MFAGTKQVRHLWWLAGLVILVQEVMSLVALGPLLDGLLSVNEATHGILSPTLAIGLSELVVNIVILLMVVGRLRPSDLGLLKGKILPGAFYALLLYLALQLVSLLVQLISGGPLGLNDEWHDAVGSNIIGQWLGNALYEEIVWRGFLFVQLGLVFRGIWPKQPVLSLSMALFISQVLFALSHLPQRILIMHPPTDFYVRDQLNLLLIGVLYALIYYRTGNLFFAIGVHALYNQAPPRLLSFPVDDYRLILYLVTLLVLVAWPVLTRQTRLFGSARSAALQPADD